MKNYWCLVLIALFLIVLANGAYAKINIESNVSGVHNLGEQVELGRVVIKGDFNGGALLKSYLDCPKGDFIFYVSPVSIEVDKSSGFDLPKIPIQKEFVGKCRIAAALEEFGGALLEDDESSEFEVSDILSANFSVKNSSAAQGDNMVFKVEIKSSGDYILDAYFSKNGSKSGFSKNFSESYFDGVLGLNNDTTRGKGVLYLSVEDRYGNSAEKSFDMDILSVPARIETDVSKQGVIPGEIFTIDGEVYDIANELIPCEIAVSMFGPDKNMINEFTISTESQKELIIPLYSAPGEYTISMRFGNQSTTASIEVLSEKKVNITNDERGIVIKNEGNVVYQEKNNIESFADDKKYVTAFDIYVSPGKEQYINLDEYLPEGLYNLSIVAYNETHTFFDIGVGDSRTLAKKISQGIGSLTGNAVIDTQDETNFIGLVIFVLVILIGGFFIARKRLKTNLLGHVGNLVKLHEIEVGSLKNSLDKEKKARREIRSMFSRYVDEDVLREAGRKGMEKREISALFTDIRGFSNLFEHMPEEEILRMLDMHFKKITEVLKKNGGFVNKFIGDSVMALFNAAREDKDHVFKAAKSAVEIKEELNKLNEKLEKKGLMRIKVGIGVDVGAANVGNLGSIEKMEYTAIGVPVNIAARIQEKATEGEALITERVYSRVKNRIAAEEFGERKLKNISLPVKIYSALRVIK